MRAASNIPPSGATIDSPTFTGTQIGDTYPATGISGAQVTAPADTNENIVATITIAANQLGANGGVAYLLSLTTVNNANAKTLRIRVGGIGGTAVVTQSLASSGGAVFQHVTQNANATNAQQSWGLASIGGVGAVTYAAISSAVDTTAATTIVITVQKATAGDSIVLNGIIPTISRLT